MTAICLDHPVYASVHYFKPNFPPSSKGDK